MLVLTPAQLQRLEHYGKLFQDSSSLGGTMIADLDHWPNSGASHGPTWPCMLKHGTIVDLGACRIGMNVDRLLALGFPVQECGNSSYCQPPCRPGHDRQQPELARDSCLVSLCLLPHVPS